MRAEQRRRRQWAEERQEVVDRWFAGDGERADAVLDALPYLSVPGWFDVDTVMEILTERGTLATEAWLSGYRQGCLDHGCSLLGPPESGTC